MRTPRPTVVQRTDEYAIRILGEPPVGLRDLYHALLRIPWWGALSVMSRGTSP